MSRELFRQEVLKARHRGWLGAISLAQPVSLWGLTLVALVAATGVVTFLFLGSYTRHSTVQGQLISDKGLATVISPSAGVVSELGAFEGDFVNFGQHLVTVATPRNSPDESDTQAALVARLTQRRDGLVSLQNGQEGQFEAQARGLLEQLSVARNEVAQIENEVLTRKDQARIAGETLARLKQLEEGRYVSLIQVKQQESVALEFEGQVQMMQREAISARRGIAQLEQALRELPGQKQISQATLQRDLAQLAQEEVEIQARGALVVDAPVSGQVAAQLVKQGQAVQIGQALMSLLPQNGSLEAELLVPSRSIGFVTTGDIVLLRYQAYPYQKFGHQVGRVNRISRSTLKQDELGAMRTNSETSEPMYRISVTLPRQSIAAYGKAEALLPGMLVEADILGEKRRLIEWVLEPVYSVKGKFADK